MFNINRIVGVISKQLHLWSSAGTVRASSTWTRTSVDLGDNATSDFQVRINIFPAFALPLVRIHVPIILN